MALNNSGWPDRLDIEKWINLNAVQLLVHHASAVVAAIVIFAMVARLAIWLLPHGVVRKIVVVIDDIVLIGLLVYFGYEMFVYLWNARPPLERKESIDAAIGAIVEAGLPPSIAKSLGPIAQALARLRLAP